MASRSLPFADTVGRRLKERGLGLREFCRAVGLDPSFFSKVLAGKRSPPSDEADLRRIAKVLQLDAPSLIVAAGRIPSEWRRLWRDPGLFDRVHRMAAGADASAASPTPSSSSTEAEKKAKPIGIPEPPRRSVAPVQAFGEELL